MKIYTNIFEEIISIESLFDSWRKFKRGKTKRKDIQNFERNLESNIFELHRELQAQTYKHGEYQAFFVHDPKVRYIRKACVRDRLVHQAVYTALVEIYEPKFIYHSFACREGKGTHKALDSLKKMTFKVSKNDTKPCFALKCDIRKFFDSMDHGILLELTNKVISDKRVQWILKEIVGSCVVDSQGGRNKGLPIGNLTSQIFANIYLNELDHFVKHELQEKYYLRYADDFIILGEDSNRLKQLIPKIESFLGTELELRLHPQKVSIEKLGSGIDFLGYVTFPQYRILRSKTKRRMLKKLDNKLEEYFTGKISQETATQTRNSYLGLLAHANTWKLSQNIRNICWIQKIFLTFALSTIHYLR